MAKQSLADKFKQEVERIAKLRRRALGQEEPEPAPIAAAPVVITTLAPVTIVKWDNCYNDGWKGLIVADAFAHPAKIARGLVRRIYDHLFEVGALKPGSYVVDPFGGVGTTGIEGASRGCHVVCVELEPKFVAFAQENFALHEHTWDHFGLPMPIIVQGDSRQLRKHVAAAFDALVSSPPFGVGDSASAQSIANRTDKSAMWIKSHKFGGAVQQGYGESEGQLAEMPIGDIEAVVSSPPYGEIATGAGGLNTKPAQHDGQQSGRNAASASQDTDQRYGETEGQLARMEKGQVDAVISSPPYAELGVTIKGHGIIGAGVSRDPNYGNAEYGHSEGQLGDLKDRGGVDAVISSPPYAETSLSGGGGIAHEMRNTYREGQNYGDEAGQLGAMKEDVGVDAVISSPPYAETTLNDDQRKAGEGGPLRRGGNKEYGTSPGQVGVLKEGAGVDAVVSSPPYANGGVHGKDNAIDEDEQQRAIRSMGAPLGSSCVTGYGETEGQLANLKDQSVEAVSEKGDTFWHAAKQIAAESFAVLKPGGYAVWIVKAFIRNKAIVDFPADWRKLCEHVGFTTELEVHAMLVKDSPYHGQLDLQGNVIEEQTQRKSFFRRLQESKGAPQIDFEVVYIMRKPA